MKKVSLLALHLNYGGVEKSIINQANMLCEDFDVELAVTYKIEDKPAFYLNPKVKVIYLTDVVPNKNDFIKAVKHLNIIKAFKEGIKSIKVLYLKSHTMKEYIKKSNSDVIISSRIEFTRLLRYSDKIKVAEEHRHHNNDQKYINSLRKALKGVDYLVNVSNDLNSFYTKEMSFLKCKLIPNSLDDEEEVISPLDTKNLIAVGRLSHEKGYLDLIDIFKLVHEKDKEIKLNIIGEGNERPLIEEKIKEYNLGNYVTLHGFQNREYIKNIMKESSLYVMTSYEESFGLVLIEAGSSAIPQIAFTSAQGANELIKNDYNGYLIENRDKEKMASVIVDLVNDKSKLKELGENAKKEADIYSYKSVKIKWVDFINEIMKEK